jgi:hypothetical protein
MDPTKSLASTPMSSLDSVRRMDFEERACAWHRRCRAASQQRADCVSGNAATGTTVTKVSVAQLKGIKARDLVLGEAGAHPCGSQDDAEGPSHPPGASKLLKKLASLTGESSNQEEPSRHLERPDEVVLDRLFETFQEWNVELDRLGGGGPGLAPPPRVFKKK